MKIYHKKNISEGTLLTGLGLLLLVTMLLRQSFRPKSVLICTAALLLGLGLLFRSLSRQCARADRLEELDERNLLIQLRSKGLAFTIVQNALLVLCRSAQRAGCCAPAAGRPSWYSAGCWSCPGCSGSYHSWWNCSAGSTMSGGSDIPLSKHHKPQGGLTMTRTKQQDFEQAQVLHLSLIHI